MAIAICVSIWTTICVSIWATICVIITYLQVVPIHGNYYYTYCYPVWYAFFCLILLPAVFTAKLALASHFVDLLIDVIDYLLVYTTHTHFIELLTYGWLTHFIELLTYSWLTHFIELLVYTADLPILLTYLYIRLTYPFYWPT